MDIFLILFICLVFYIGYIVGCHMTYYKLSRIFTQLATSLGVDLEQELLKLKKLKERKSNNTINYNCVELETEVHGDMIYLFDKERNDFIAQAKSIDELAKLTKEIKKIDDAIVIHGDKVFRFINGKSEEKNNV